MESNFRNRDFEQYVKENADQYRMFPSEKVWKGIHGSLHTRRKWYGAGLALLLLMTGAAVTWVMVSYPVSKDQPVAIAKQSIAATADLTPAATSPETIDKVLPFSKINTAQKKALGSQLEPGRIPAFIAADDRANLVTNIAVPQQPTFTRNDKNQFAPVMVHHKAATSAHEITGDYYDIIEPASEAKTSRSQSDLIMPRSDRPSRFNDDIYPLLGEGIANNYLPKKENKKISWQVFITPTISYRVLSVNKSAETAAAAGFPFSTTRDINKAVTHKPDMGLQFGVAARYPVTNKLKIRGGLQFNINRYDIKAFAYNPEVATINLNEPNGINSVSTWTYYRTRNGYKSDWLKNYYFSISAPIGAEMTLFGNKKTSFGVAGSIQPTYIIKDRAYLLSTDYKNYAEVPWLIRHVNVNTGFETFVNYTSGKTKWQIGPQVRYQVLSSFRNKYPVKENLFDFGVKVGVSLNQ